MYKFKKPDIDKWREEFISRKYPKMEAMIDNRSIDYFVMPTNVFQGIPNGLFRMTGEPNDGYVVGVSTEVPDVIQPHFALSEHDEFLVYGLDDSDRTLHSEQNMLTILKDEDATKKLYIDNKVILYEYMLEKSRDDLEKWGFTKDDYSGFQRAVNFLKSKK
jgi:hypothetical protein